MKKKKEIENLKMQKKRKIVISLKISVIFFLIKL